MSGGQPPPPGFQPPPGYGPPPGYQAPMSYAYGPPPPSPARMGRGAIVAVFIGALLGLALLAAVVVLASQPPGPDAQCPPGRPCAPQSSLPPISESSPMPSAGATPITPTSAPTSTPPATPGPSSTPPTASPGPTSTPLSDSPPIVSGEVWRSATLGYSFEYDPDSFKIIESDDDTAIFSAVFYDAQVIIEATDASTSPAEMIARQLALVDDFVIGRVLDDDEYDALLGPSIGYVRGEGAVYSGTLLARDGTPIAPAGVTVLASTDGRLTVAIVIIVATPDARLGAETHQHTVRSVADEFLKTFDWGSQ